MELPSISNDTSELDFSEELAQQSSATDPASGSSADLGALRHLWQSPWTVWIGLRYLKSKKNSRFLSFITLMSVMGVGLGVTAMVVVLSVMDGFESELKKRMMNSDLHLLIRPTAQLPNYQDGMIAENSITPEKLRQWNLAFPGEIVSFWPILSTEAILKAGRRVTGVVLKGVPVERLRILEKSVVEASPDSILLDPASEPPDTRTHSVKTDSDTQRFPGVLLGQELAYEMGVAPDDPLTLVSPTEMEGPMSAIPRFKRYRVQGIFHSGLPDQELHTVFARPEAVQSFLRKKGGVSQWEVVVRDFERAPLIAERIRKDLPGFQIEDWKQLNAHLFASLQLERISMFVILAFIIVVASFNIVTTLTLMVLEKKKEISILKAMGARHGQIAAVFLSEGILIGLVGIGGGLSLSLIICLLLRRYEFITLPEIYYDRTLPVTFNVSYYGLIGLCSAAIVLLACLYPSRRAAKMNPLEGIRN